jgi:hypothetical protein
MRKEPAPVFSTVDDANPDFMRSSNMMPLTTKAKFDKTTLLQTDTNFDTLGKQLRESANMGDFDGGSSNA